MTKYSVSGRKGIDDLKGLHAFVGNSQGDTSASNSIEDFKNSGGWMSFVFDCPMTDEAITKEIENRKQWNDKYIEKLNNESAFGETYTIDVELISDPLFDKPQVLKDKSPIESFRMVFLNLNEKQNGTKNNNNGL